MTLQQCLLKLDMEEVAEVYARRVQTHRELRRLFEAENIKEFVDLALGISDSTGNYSATEHKVQMGSLILSECQPWDVFELARKLDQVEKKYLPLTIQNEDIRNLKISIGSEMAMMLRPNELWVGNKRTYWASLLVEHGNHQRANEELELYYDREGEMPYEIWSYLYLRVESQLLDLGREAAKVAGKSGIKPGSLCFMWADAVATNLFGTLAFKP
ncbi:MAG: hypothetical protein WD851_17045 [Pirellulales bacterium]